MYSIILTVKAFLSRIFWWLYNTERSEVLLEDYTNSNQYWAINTERFLENWN